MLNILTIFGTRPEAIKLAPVILELRRHPIEVHSRICVTGQHREMLDQVLQVFGLTPDIDLNLMRPNQTLPDLTARSLATISAVMADEKPDLVLVQGDTTTVMTASLAAFYHRVPVGHVEAGLRTHDIYAPFPEEINRRLTSVISTYHFCPTTTAHRALIEEGASLNRLFITGNTVIDAAQHIASSPVPCHVTSLLQKIGIDANSNNRQLILVTAHRRENLGPRLESICQGLRLLAEQNPNVAIIYPVHLNPNVQRTVYDLLGNVPRIFLVPPVSYDVMIHLIKAAKIVITDSGGLQEEAPALNTPVLILRNETERPEGVEAGVSRLIGTDAQSIVEHAEMLLCDQFEYEAMARSENPYGDGCAAKRIVEILLQSSHCQ